MTQTEPNGMESIREIAKLSFKPPPFWKPDPKLWFAQVEAQFARAGISTDETKFHTVVAEIDSSILKCASDLILKPPQNNKYETLKARLITEFEESATKRLKRLLEDNSISQKRPSNLLREMLELAEGWMDEKAIKPLFLRKLPLNVQQILSVMDGNLESLAKKANEIMDLTEAEQLNAVQNESSTNTRTSDLYEAVNELSKKVDRLGRTNRKLNREQSPQLSRSHTPVCWYHRTFRQASTKCRPPCKYSRHVSGNE